MITFDEALILYASDFDRIIVTIEWALQNNTVLHRGMLRKRSTLPNNYWTALYRSIQKQLVPGINTYPIEREDLKQQLLLVWWLCYVRCSDQRFLKKELRRFSLFRMRNWIRSQVRVARQEPFAIVQSTESSAAMPELNLKFLVNGSKQEPFCYLSKRDRYELYLHYVNEKSITEMVDIVRYRKQNVIDHFKANYAFIRSNYDQV